MKKLFSFLFAVALLMPSMGAVAQQKYGAKPLEFESLKEWKKVHRPAIMDFFLTDVYGHYPQKQVTPRFELLEQSDKALGGKAVRKQVAIHLDGMDTPILLLIYQPAGVKGKVPVDLTYDEQLKLKASADALKEVIRSLDI